MFGLGNKQNKQEQTKESMQNKQKVEAILSNKRIKEREKEIRTLLENKDLPIVTLDALWYNVKEQIFSDTIRQNETKLNELLKEQGKIHTDFKEYTAVKQNLLKQVLEVSEQVNEKGETQKAYQLDSLHDTILKTNEKLDEAVERLEKIKEEIKEVNLKIVEETVSIGYEYMEVYKKNKIELEQEIDMLRQQVVLKTEQKKQYEYQLSRIYDYMHKVIGYKYIDKVDRKLWSKDK